MFGSFKKWVDGQFTYVEIGCCTNLKRSDDDFLVLKQEKHDIVLKMNGRDDVIIQDVSIGQQLVDELQIMVNKMKDWESKDV